MNLLFKFLILIFIFCNSLLFSNDLKKVSLQLLWKHQFQFAGFIMAKEKGFYKDIGLDVELKQWDKDIDIVDETLSQNVQYSLLRPTSLIDIAKGKDILYLAAIFQSSPLIVLANKNSSIKTVHDFEHKRFMSSGGLNNEASLMAMMFSQGVDIKTIKIESPSFNLKDLISGNIDLQSAYISNEPFIMKELGEEPLIFDPKDYGFEFYNDILATSKNYYNQNKNEVKEFKKASLKGWEYAFNNINETIEIILKKYNSLHKSKEALLYEAKELKKLAYHNTNSIGDINPSKLERIYEVYKVLGFAKKNINFNNYILKYKNLQFTPEEKKYLKNKKEIKLCVDPNWMPFEKIEKEKHIGLTAEYFKHISEILSTKFTLYPTKSWSESLNAVKRRKCDVLTLAMRTPERRSYLNFTTPYINMPLVIVTRLDIAFINEISSLKNRKLAVPKGYAYLDLLKNKYPYLDFVEVKDIDDGLDKVNNKSVFGYIGTLATVEYKFQKSYFNELKIAGKFDETWQLAIGVRNDDPTLLNILEKSMQIISNEERQSILETWQSINYKRTIDFNIAIKVMVVVIILILFFIYKQYLLKKSIKEFNELINATLEGIAISKDGIIIDANRSTLEMLNLNSINEIKNRPLSDFIAKESIDIAMNSLKVEKTDPYEVILITNDGKRFNALVRGSSLKNRNLRISSFIDITKLKNQEKLLVEQSKMMALGEMLSNIAHQWRQPLAAISAASTGLKLQKEHNILSDEHFFEACDTINNYSQYLSRTIDDFKNYAKGDTKPIKFNLKENTESFLLLVESFIKKYNLDIKLISKDNIDIHGYPNQLIQCLINLFYNSNDILKSKDPTERYIQISQSVKSNKVIIKFRDNGGGIPNNIIEKIFEPYFTTKHKSQGTGLGLHMTYNLIINGMKGSIEVSNVNFTYKGKNYTGAEFIIKLPLNS